MGAHQGPPTGDDPKKGPLKKGQLRPIVGKMPIPAKSDKTTKVTPTKPKTSKPPKGFKI